jgi:hypothetical protein
MQPNWELLVQLVGLWGGQLLRPPTPYLLRVNRGSNFPFLAFTFLSLLFLPTSFTTLLASPVLGEIGRTWAEDLLSPWMLTVSGYPPHRFCLGLSPRSVPRRHWAGVLRRHERTQRSLTEAQQKKKKQICQPTTSPVHPLWE